jgi:cardiolipin synthase
VGGFMKKIFKYVPNILTVIRFLLIPIIIVMLTNGNYIGATIVFSLSGITDILDGFIARKFNLISDFGKLMDPLADKATQLSILFTLTAKRIIPFWIVSTVTIKEFLMVCGASFLYGKDLVVSSKWYGKASTVLFYIAIVLSLVLKQLSEDMELNSIIRHIDKPFYTIAILMTLFALVMYIKAFLVKGYLKNKFLREK